VAVGIITPGTSTNEEDSRDARKVIKWQCQRDGRVSDVKQVEKKGFKENETGERIKQKVSKRGRE
jgi:hypothetical protein